MYNKQLSNFHSTKFYWEDQIKELEIVKVGEMKNEKKIWVQKPEGNRPRGRTKHRSGRTILKLILKK